MGDVRERPRKRTLRCRIGYHRWVRAANDDGGVYLRCRVCGKDDDFVSRFVPL